MNSKAIIFTCNSTFGLANFRLPLMMRLQQEGYRVVAVAPRDEYAERLESVGIELHHWNLSARNTNPYGEVLAVWQLIKLYRDVQPIICFHYTIKAVLYGAISAHLNSIRFVSIITGLGYVFLNDGVVSRISRWLYRLLLLRSYRVWFLNREDREEFLQLGLVPPAAAEVLPGEGVDTNHFRMTPKTDGEENSKFIKFLVISRLLGDKGIYELVTAIDLFRARGFNAKFSVLGARGSQNPTGIPDLVVDRWVSEGKFEYLGTALDVRPFIQAADCVVLPSYREGLPRALLEAAAMARPLVATDVPGCRDVVVNGTTGFLCSPRDPNALAEALQRVVELPPELRRIMGLRGREFVEKHFSDDVVIQQYLSLLSDQS